MNKLIFFSLLAFITIKSFAEQTPRSLMGKGHIIVATSAYDAKQTTAQAIDAAKQSIQNDCNDIDVNKQGQVYNYRQLFLKASSSVDKTIVSVIYDGVCYYNIPDKKSDKLTAAKSDDQQNDDQNNAQTPPVNNQDNTHVAVQAATPVAPTAAVATPAPDSDNDY